MSDDADVKIYRHYCPPGVKRVIASGSSAFIGEVDESTVLNYPLEPSGDMSRRMCPCPQVDTHHVEKAMAFGL